MRDFPVMPDPRSEYSLSPVLGLLAAAPYPMAPVDVAVVLHADEGAVRLALRLLEEAGRARKRMSDGRELWAIVPTTEVGREAVHGIRQGLLRKQVDEMERIARPLIRRMEGREATPSI